jgi:hypothetical protein
MLSIRLLRTPLLRGSLLFRQCLVPRVVGCGAVSNGWVLNSKPARFFSAVKKSKKLTTVVKPDMMVSPPTSATVISQTIEENLEESEDSEARKNFKLEFY